MLSGKPRRTFSVRPMDRMLVAAVGALLLVLVSPAAAQSVSELPQKGSGLQTARGDVATALLPAPWTDGEALQLIMKLDSGADIGAIISTVDLDQLEHRSVWRLGTLRYQQLNQGRSQVTVDFETLHPLRSTFATMSVNPIQVEYAPPTLTIHRTGEAGTRTVEVRGIIYDNEQAVHLFRRLPLVVGYEITVPVFTPVSATLGEVTAKVTDRKTIEVPAGKYECFKVELGKGVGQTFWISTDAHRYLVKFEAGAFFAELTAIRNRYSYETNEFRDDKVGFTVAAPPGWFFYSQLCNVEETEALLNILDPDAAATTVLWVSKVEPGKKPFGGDLRVAAEGRVASRKKIYKDYTVRPESWTERMVSGYPALSYIADFLYLNKEMVEYVTLVGGTATSSAFHSRLEKSQAEGFHGKYEEILNQLQVR
jgi:hypothetical protein